MNFTQVYNFGSEIVKIFKISNFSRYFGWGSLSRSGIRRRMKEYDWKSFPVSSTELQLKLLLDCGQSFRWKKNPNETTSEWTGVFGHHVWTLKQDEETLFYKVHPTIKDAETLLRRYFQLDVSVSDLYKEWSKSDPKFQELTLKDFQGIRILRQDPIETTFAFICSSNNNISRITQMVEKLCVNYGQPLGVVNGKTYFDFPSVEKLGEDGVEKKLREEGFGYRAGYIVKSAVKIKSNGGQEWIQGLASLPYQEARTQLQTLPGVGRKVADCICLMALGFHEAIPVDTHIHQVGKQYLPHLAKVKTLTEKVYSEISEYFQGMHGNYAGWAQSVLFASTLRHLKDKSTDLNADKSKSKAKTTKRKVENSKTERNGKRSKKNQNS